MAAVAPQVPAEAVAAPRARARTRPDQPRVARGVAWIVVIGIMLVGIVFLNVVVLRLNIRLDHLGRQRTQLQGDNNNLAAEVASALEGVNGSLEQLWRHPIQRREFGAHLTNVLRGLYLEAHGYKVRVTEFTGFEHTQKNEMIFAERHQRSNPRAKAEFEKLKQEIGAGPKLLFF